jgi:hypothetical protein
MGITSTEPKRSHAQILTDYLEGAGLSQRNGAKALRIPYPPLRRYCSGSLDTPIAVLLAAQQLPLLDRKLQIIRLLESGKLSTSDGQLTKARLIEINKTLRNVIGYLIGRTGALR